MTKTYFVYEHSKADTLEVFYVGKGTRHCFRDYRRATDFCRRKRSWKAIAQKHGVVATVIAEFWIEDDAIDFEAGRIAAYGRRDAGTGPLINHTDGGYGASGYKHSAETVELIRARNIGKVVADETRAKISQSLSGERHPGWGKKQAAITSERKRASMQGVQRGGNSPLAMRVLDTSTGVVFPSTRDAAEHLGIPMSTMAHKLRGYRTNNTTMRYA